MRSLRRSEPSLSPACRQAGSVSPLCEDAGYRIINETNSFMDRQRIIQANYLRNSCPNNDSSCGEEICECDELKTEREKKQLRKIEIIVLLAFACALNITILKINVAETNLQTEKARTIAC